jgi:hypothetical protein
VTKYHLDDLDEDIWTLLTQRGWSTSDSMIGFLELLREYGPYRDQSQRILLMLDTYSAHRTVEVKQAAEALNIDLSFVPPGMTDSGQPLDRAIFGPYKSIGNRLFHNWLMGEIRKGIPHPKVSAEDVAKHFTRAWKQITPATIANGWAIFRAAELDSDEEDEMVSDDDSGDPTYYPDSEMEMLLLPEDEQSRAAAPMSFLTADAREPNVTVYAVASDVAFPSLLVGILDSFRGQVNVMVIGRAGCREFLGELGLCGISFEFMKARDFRVGWENARDRMIRGELQVVVIWPENFTKVAFGRGSVVHRFLTMGGYPGKVVMPFASTGTEIMVLLHPIDHPVVEQWRADHVPIRQIVNLSAE